MALEPVSAGGGSALAGQNLTPAEQRQVAALAQRDAEVRRHEQAHSAVGGQYAGAPRYQYTTGPDNKRYAVAGEVSIDVSPIPGDPRATIAKMQIVRRAALAPTEPSAQDRQVAAQAQAEIARAQSELAEERLDQARGSADTRAGLIAAQESRPGDADRPIDPLTLYRRTSGAESGLALASPLG